MIMCKLDLMHVYFRLKSTCYANLLSKLSIIFKPGL